MPLEEASEALRQAVPCRSVTFNPAVEACFGKLSADFGAKFGQYKQRNMAFDVVEVLGWKGWNNFRDDPPISTSCLSPAETAPTVTRFRAFGKPRTMHVRRRVSWQST
jgi:hypothetical protein